MSGSLNAEQEIRSLSARYARAVDRRDWELLASLFTPAGRIEVFDSGGIDSAPSRAFWQGGPQITQAIATLLDRYFVTTHFLGQQLVEIDGDRATAETYCLAHHLSCQEDGQSNRVVAVRYLDACVRDEGRWRFEVRRLIVDWTEIRTTT